MSIELLRAHPFICEKGKEISNYDVVHTSCFILQGVHCFDHSKKLNLLVTGAPDHMVRLWNPYVCNKPITILEGHYSAVIDVVIYEYLEQVFSYSADAVGLLTIIKTNQNPETKLN